MALIGEHTDLETGFAIQKFMSHFEKDNIECRTDNQSILPSLESYRFNTPIANIEDADLVILCGTNPKIESPIINHKILNLIMLALKSSILVMISHLIILFIIWVRA